MPHSTSLAILQAPGFSMVLPSVIAEAGHDAAQQRLEFFTARIRNAHTREAYGRAVFRFCALACTTSLARSLARSPAIEAPR